MCSQVALWAGGKLPPFRLHILAYIYYATATTSTFQLAQPHTSTAVSVEFGAETTTSTYMYLAYEQ
jgi:hypothetical protein